MSHHFERLLTALLHAHNAIDKVALGGEQLNRPRVFEDFDRQLKSTVIRLLGWLPYLARLVDLGNRFGCLLQAAGEEAESENEKGESAEIQLKINEFLWSLSFSHKPDPPRDEETCARECETRKRVVVEDGDAEVDHLVRLWVPRGKLP